MSRSGEFSKTPDLWVMSPIKGGHCDLPARTHLKRFYWGFRPLPPTTAYLRPLPIVSQLSATRWQRIDLPLRHGTVVKPYAGSAFEEYRGGLSKKRHELRG